MTFALDRTDVGMETHRLSPAHRRGKHFAAIDRCSSAVLSHEVQGTGGTLSRVRQYL